MFSSSLSKARLSCACFFLAPGLTYSLFTSRLPAIREQAGLNEAEIGMLILYFGLAALASLLVSATLVRHFGSRSLAIIFTITLLLSITASCAARDELFLACAFMCGGFSMGIADVCINTQGMLLEMRFKSPSMSFLHGAYSFGALFGSLSGALFASFSLSPMINAAVVLGCYSLLLTTAFRGLQKDTDRPASGTARAKKSHVPVFVICCGLLVSWAYAADGSVAEWGSLYLFSCRGADEETAALAYGAFSVTSGVFRLFDGRLRSLWGDMRLSVGGALLAFGGMAIALVSPEPWFCLAGYCLMGMGLSPMVPIFFSRAGSCPGVAPEQASAAVSLLGYSGLLLFPPTLGFLGRTLGLDRALLVPLGLGALLALGASRTLPSRPALPARFSSPSALSASVTGCIPWVQHDLLSPKGGRNEQAENCFQAGALSAPTPASCRGGSGFGHGVHG